MFTNIWSTLVVVMLIITVSYMIISFRCFKTNDLWKRKIFALAGLGLLLCISVVMRDDYVLSLQGGKGQFPMHSVPIYLAYVGALTIAISILFTLFTRNARYLKVLFVILSFAILFKIGIIEVSRLFM